MKRLLALLLITLALPVKVVCPAQTVVNTGNHRKLFTAVAPVSGMTLWFAADCITFTSSVCGVPSNGTSISAWADESGNANNWSKTSGTCTFNTNQINTTLPAVTFASCYGNFVSAVTATSGHTVFIVYKTTSNSAGYILGSAALGGYAYEPAGLTGAQIVDRQNVINVGNATNHATSGTWMQQNAAMQNATPAFVMTFRQSSATDTTASSTSSNITVNGPSGMGADLFGTPSGLFNGQVAEILYYNALLNSTQIQQNEAYFRAKYGVS